VSTHKEEVLISKTNHPTYSQLYRTIQHYISMSSSISRRRRRPVESSSSSESDNEAPEEVAVTTAKENELNLLQKQAEDEAKREARRRERKKAAAAKMRERQEKARQKKLSAEKEAELLLEQEKEATNQADSEEGDDDDDDDVQDASGLTAKDYRKGQAKEGFNVRVLHDDDEDDDHVLTYRTTSSKADEFLKRARGNTKRAEHRHLSGFNSGSLTQKKSYRRKRPTKRQKREWEAEKIRTANDSDADEGPLFE
jgi:hypothetical protein